MFKQLILTVALLSSTYGGSTTEYIDPEISLVSLIHKLISVESEAVALSNGTDHETMIRRLNDSIEAQISKSQAPDELIDAVIAYSSITEDLSTCMHSLIGSDSTLQSDNSLALANYIREIFWHRIVLLSKILQNLLALAHDRIDPETLAVCKQIKHQLDVLKSKLLSEDISPVKIIEFMSYMKLVSDGRTVHRKSKFHK